MQAQVSRQIFGKDFGWPLENPQSGQGLSNFALKNPTFGQGNLDFSASKTQNFGQPFGGASRGLFLSKDVRVSATIEVVGFPPAFRFCESVPSFPIQTGGFQPQSRWLAFIRFLPVKVSVVLILCAAYDWVSTISSLFVKLGRDFLCEIYRLRGYPYYQGSTLRHFDRNISSARTEVLQLRAQLPAAQAMSQDLLLINNINLYSVPVEVTAGRPEFVYSLLPAIYVRSDSAPFFAEQHFAANTVSQGFRSSATGAKFILRAIFQVTLSRRAMLRLLTSSGTAVFSSSDKLCPNSAVGVVIWMLCGGGSFVSPRTARIRAKAVHAVDVSATIKVVGPPENPLINNALLEGFCERSRCSESRWEYRVERP
ncbi:hypothetical protein C8R43DRAFT_958761 [Mycena crocata]|nr:hypothetical protein C8R43DRAFT_958761 [Mycena crocata]